MNHSSTGRRAAAVAAALALGSGALFAAAPAEAAKAKPLTGKVSATVPMGCNILGTDFAYEATVTVAGKRATKKAKAVSLTATMSDMPGMAPLALDYDTAPELTLKVGSATAKLKGKGHIDVAAYDPAPVAPMKGSAKVSGSKLAVSVTKLDYVVLNADGSELTRITCTPAESGAVGKLKLK